MAAATAPGPRKRARRSAAGFGRRETWAAYAFLSPWIIGFLVFTSGPMVASFVLSLTEYEILTPPRYIGFENYSTLVDDPKIRKSLANTLIFTVMLVPATMIVALALAMVLIRVGRAAGFFRTVFYLPEMTPPVAVGIMFLLLFNGSYGLINSGIEKVGLPGPFWTTDPNWVKPGLVLMSVWSVGGTMVIYLAALASVPRQLYEASAMDGAKPWRRFKDVTLPMISPALYFTGLILTIAGLQTFTEAYTAFFGNAATQTYSSDAALFYVIYLVQQAFQFLHMGYASAMAWLLFVVIVTITLVQAQLSKRFVFYQGQSRPQ